MKKKNAFTLAEVLITLGIIGVVAAMTLPTLIEKHQKKVTATRLKAAYSIFSQALLAAQKDYDEPKYWDSARGQVNTGTSNDKLGTIAFVEKYVLPYIKVGKSYGWKTLNEVGYKNGWVNLNGTQRTSSSSSSYFIELPNQTLVAFRHNNFYINGTDGPTSLTDLLFYIDINGKQKPNILGRDIFWLYYDTANGKINAYYIHNKTPRDTILEKYCSKSKSESAYCTAVIMLDGWDIKDDYPW